MLALTPMPLQTAGERALFAELNRWDTGGAVRAAVVASIPVGDDGPLQRRLSDAVLFVPEGIAVVRIVEVVRQSGVVTALPEGAWTIAPGAGPGEVLQLAGGGSTPLDGLMRAGMDAAVRLRRAGLEPGRIARLTVLVGDLTGLQPTDGDLGEGDQVALLEPRSLLLGIARASRYAGVDNPRLWTTADVRAALEALGLQGRGPSVEELNGEGFPYSPYVLRRPELLAPAGLAAGSSMSSTSSASATPSPAVAAAVSASVASAMAASALEAPAAPATSQPAAVPQPAAAMAAPAQQTTAMAAPAQQAPSGAAAYADPFAGRPVRDTIDISAGPTMDQSDGIGGLFASAEPVPEAPQLPPVPPSAGTPARTAVFDQPQPVWPTTPDRPQGEQRLLDRRVVEQGTAGPGSHRRLVILVAAAVAAVLVLVVGGLLLLGGGNGSGGGAAAQTSADAGAGPAGSLQAGDVQEVDGVDYTVEAVKVDDTCVGHSYGQVAGFFQSKDCTGLARALYSAQVNGQPVVVSVSRVQLADAATARQLRALTDSNGTGNVSDLLREGTRYSGGPEALHDSEYASAVSGSAVTIVESSWAGGAGGSSEQLNVVASSGLALPVPSLPAK